jgi:hypothetical protein
MANQIHAFQSHRLYTVNGQRIAWTVLSTGNVAMIDLDRMIEYILLPLSEDFDREYLRVMDSDSAKLMHAYDRNLTARYSNAEQEEFRALKPAMREAAVAVPKPAPAPRFGFTA